ncbi:MAG: hypothetical protein K6E20_06815 [Acholeplasmatales bacterium]|nr:hypothetical protein [Acholeplasmatales bacterium]
MRYADDCNIFVRTDVSAERVMKSVTSWLERKLFLKVSATKTKITRPTNSNFLGFTFWKNGDEWKCKPGNDRKAKLYEKIKVVLKRKHAVSRPLAITFTKLNQIIRGWINYFRIGSMKLFIDEFGQWLRHKVRVIIVKQWKKTTTIYRNLQMINKANNCGFSDEEIYMTAKTRLGWYRQCGMKTVGYILNPNILSKPNKKRNRPGLVNPLLYYLR